MNGNGAWVYESRKYPGNFHSANLVLQYIYDVEWDWQAQFASGIPEQIDLYWSVVPDPNAPDQPLHSETAPFTVDAEEENFLTHYTWPTDRYTHEPIDWFAMPVIACAEVMGKAAPDIPFLRNYRPSALQAFVPARLIAEQTRYGRGTYDRGRPMRPTFAGEF